MMMIMNTVSSKIQEVESQLCLEDNMESSASGGLSNHTKKKIYVEVAPKKKNRIYGVGSLKHEASSAHSGPPPPSTDDLVVLAEKLAVVKASLASQATQMQLIADQMQLITEKMQRYDAYFDYIAEKDPEFAAKFGFRTPTTTEHGCNQTIADTGDDTCTSTSTTRDFSVSQSI